MQKGKTEAYVIKLYCFFCCYFISSWRRLIYVANSENIRKLYEAIRSEIKEKKETFTFFVVFFFCLNEMRSALGRGS